MIFRKNQKGQIHYAFREIVLNLKIWKVNIILKSESI